MPDKLNYLIIENAFDVCDGIERRMEPYNNWQLAGACGGVKEAIRLISNIQPQLIFLDWGLNGGSAFEVLQHIQNMSAYNPYILFNTGFQKDNPEIPQEIINNYKVDKYIVKPFWENLRNNLPVYLKEAEVKATTSHDKEKIIWLEDDNGTKVLVCLDKLICICQHPLHARSRIFYLDNHINEITIPLQWHKCYELLIENSIDFFITKNRSHLVVKGFIEKFEKPFVRLVNFPAKVEVVKENIKDFENWLVRK